MEAEGEELALFCGREETDTEAVPAQQLITSPRNSLSIIFTSDFSNEERYTGFMAHYRAEGEDQVPGCGSEFISVKDQLPCIEDPVRVCVLVLDYAESTHCRV